MFCNANIFGGATLTLYFANIAVLSALSVCHKNKDKKMKKDKNNNILVDDQFNEFAELEKFELEKTGAAAKKKRKKRGSKIGKMLIIMTIGLIAAFFILRLEKTQQIFDLIKQWKKAKEAVPEVVEEELALVKVFHIIKTDFKDNLPVIGTVRGIKELDYRFANNGTINKLNFDEGELVGQDEILAELIQDEVKIKIEYQKANFEAAQSTFWGASKKLANAEKMYQLGAILISKLDESILEADNAAAKMKAAEYELESAKKEIDKTVIKSNIAGVIGVVHNREGEYVTTNDKVITLIDISTVYVDVGITEKDIDKIAIGLTGAVIVDAYPDKAFSGEIVNILPVVEGKSRTVTAKLQVDNSENLLLPGMFARTDIAIFEDKDTIMIPSVALHRQKEGYSVNVVDENNVVAARAIDVGYITIDYVQVVGGLEVDEFIVVETQEDLKDGDKVQIIEVQESTLK